MRRALTRGALQVQTPRTTRCFSSLQPAPLPSLDGGVFDVVVFPGQGAQRPGMAKDLADNFKEARLVLEEVDEALKFNLSKLMFSGTEVSREGEKARFKEKRCCCVRDLSPLRTPPLPLSLPAG